MHAILIHVLVLREKTDLAACVRGEAQTCPWFRRTSAALGAAGRSLHAANEVSGDCRDESPPADMVRGSKDSGSRGKHAAI